MAAVSFGVCLLLAACAPPRTALPPTTPLTQQTPTTEASPSPSPTPAASSPLAISKIPFHSGEVGLPYSVVTLAATGGVKPYSWSATSMPGGLTLSPAGVVGGTPNSPGAFGFIVSVSDAAGGAASVRASVTVYQALAMTEPCASKCVVGKGCSKCGSFGTATKGLAPYSYKIVGGAIPKGMTWSGLALKGGFPAGNFALSVQVTDKLGAHVRVDASWSIYGPATLLKGRTSDCVSSANPPSCTDKWTYTGGNPSVAPTLVITGYQPYCNANGCYPTMTAPPLNWKVTIGAGTITITAGGNPCSPPANDYGYVSFVLRDPSACATTSPSNTGTMYVFLENNC